MTDRELMQRALEALEQYVDYEGATSSADKAITALRERLAQPEQSPLDRMAENARELGLDYEPVQEPVAWMYRGNLHPFDPSDWAEGPVTPLYTAPPRREWVGLTKEEAKEISMANRPYVVDMIAALEARLKEKNT